MKKIIVCGGHLTPALSLIEELKGEENLQIIFFGRKYATEGSKSESAEFKIITGLKIPFYNIKGGRLQRRFTRFTLTSLLKIPIGFAQSLYYLMTLRPHFIVSFGGYLSVPPVICGWLIGIPTIAHEQAVVPGLATKINSLFVDKIFLTWPQSQKYFDTKKIEVIGNLFQKSIFNKKPKSKIIAAFLKKAQNLMVIMGGNQGSHVLNILTFDLVKKVKGFQFLHQVGSTNWEGDLDKAKKIKLKNYLALEYIGSQDLGGVLEKAKIVISRSGANTVWDLALLKKSAIFVPIPTSSGGEQIENAKILEKVGQAIIVNQNELSTHRIIDAKNKLNSLNRSHGRQISEFSKSLPQTAGIKMAKYITGEINND